MSTPSSPHHQAEPSPLALPQSSASASAHSAASHRVIVLPTTKVPFDGEGTKFSGWCLKVRAVLDCAGLFSAVEQPLSGSSSSRSVIEGAVVGESDVLELQGGSVGSGAACAEHVNRAKAAYTYLVCQLGSDDLADLIADVPLGNAHELWRRLHAHYARNTQASAMQLTQEFHQLRMKGGETVALYTARFKKAVLALKALTPSRPVDKATMLYKYVDGLEQPKYKGLRDQLRYTSKEAGLEEIIELAQAEESQAAIDAQRAGATQEQAHFAATESKGLHGRSRGGAQQGGAGVYLGTCHSCSKPGHSSNYCPQRPGGPMPPCTYCKKPFHTLANCRTAKADKAAANGSGAGAGVGAASAARQQVALMAEVIEEANAVELSVVEQAAGAQASVGIRALVDSGASKHFLMREIPLQGAVVEANVKIKVASGRTLAAPSVGAANLVTADGKALNLTNVHQHKHLNVNLLSVSALCGKDGFVLFSAEKAQIMNKNKDVLWEAQKEQNGVYALQLTAASAELIANTQKQEQQRLWHARLGHLADSGMHKLISAKAVVGLEQLSKCEAEELCNNCVKGKAHRAPFGLKASERSRATKPLGRVHADLCGPFTPSAGGALHFLLLVDEFSRKYFLFPLKHKSEAAAKIMSWCRQAVLQADQEVVEFHSDNGGEFISNELKSFFERAGIRATTTVAGTPQHNGMCERGNRTICEGVVAMMQAAGAHSVLWSECALARTYVYNLTVVRAGQSETPEGLWKASESKPSVEYLRVWGCDAWVWRPANERSKLEAKAQITIFVGYCEQRAPVAYRLYIVETGQIIISRDVQFDESKFTQCAALVAKDRTSNSDLQDFDDIVDENEVRLMELISLQQLEEDRKAREAKGVNAAASAAGCVAIASTPVRARAAAVEEFKEAAEPAAAAESEAPVESVVGPEKQRRKAIPAESVAPTAGSQAESRFVEGRNRAAKNKPLSRYGMVDERDVGALAAEAEAMSLELEECACSALTELDLEDPQSFEEAMNSPEAAQWKEAMDKELASMESFKVWVLVQLPAGARTLKCKWIFKRKFDKDGHVARYKARLVVQGFAQRKGVDYGATYAAVLSYHTLRIILFLVAFFDLELKQMDVPTAFLNAFNVGYNLYVSPPAGLKLPGGGAQGGIVCQLLKTLYGIKQAPRCWGGDLAGSIMELGYTRCTADACVFIKTSKTAKMIIIAVFVDDIFPACSKVDEAEMDADIAVLMAKYKIPTCSNAELVLGMLVTRDREARTLKLSQRVYLEKILKRFNMQDCKPATTPALERPSKEERVEMAAAERAAGAAERATKEKELEEEEQEDSAEEEKGTARGSRAEAHENYRAAVGGLLYASVSTRPDIAYATSVLSRAVSNPSPAHHRALKHLLRYIRGTVDMGLTFGGGAKPTEGEQRTVVLEVLADADWGGNLSDRRSMTGILCKLNGSTISWASKRQPVVALSSCEAEYMAAGAAAQQIVWLRTLLAELGWPQEEGTTLWCDNQSAISLASDDMQSAHTKHIDIRHHFIRFHVADGRIVLEWLPTSEQEADLLTKALGRVLFQRFRARIMGGDVLEHGGAPAGVHK